MIECLPISYSFLVFSFIMIFMAIGVRATIVLPRANKEKA
jgi:hypothetical protein